MKLTDIRRARLRELMEQRGASNLATALGYRQPSFLSQMAGPNPSRDITEKTARRFERDLELPVGYLDQPPTSAPAAAEQSAGGTEQAAENVALVADVIRLVGSIAADEQVELATVKFADIVALAYVDTMEHSRTPRPDHIKQLVRLFK